MGSGCLCSTSESRGRACRTCRFPWFFLESRCWVNNRRGYHQITARVSPATYRPRRRRLSLYRKTLSRCTAEWWMLNQLRFMAKMAGLGRSQTCNLAVGGAKARESLRSVPSSHLWLRRDALLKARRAAYKFRLGIQIYHLSRMQIVIRCYYGFFDLLSDGSSVLTILSFKNHTRQEIVQHWGFRELADVAIQNIRLHLLFLIP